MPHARPWDRNGLCRAPGARARGCRCRRAPCVQGVPAAMPARRARPDAWHEALRPCPRQFALPCCFPAPRREWGCPARACPGPERRAAAPVASAASAAAPPAPVPCSPLRSGSARAVPYLRSAGTTPGLSCFPVPPAAPRPVARAMRAAMPTRAAPPAPASSPAARVPASIAARHRCRWQGGPSTRARKRPAASPARCPPGSWPSRDCPRLRS